MEDKPPHPLTILIALPCALICGINSKFYNNKSNGKKKVSNS